jgi:acyl-[acyl-carrier-protein] desaturase
LLTVIPGPISRQAKQAAIQKEVRKNYDDYFSRAARTRSWFPDRLPQRKEMAKYAHLVSAESRELLLGFLGVESFVDDYVFEGIKAAGNSVTTRELYISWGFEERRHGQTFRYALIDSGFYTQEWVDRYLAEVAEDQWTFKRQTGYEATPLLAAAYAIFQERQTRWNYAALRMRLWREYGSLTDQAGRRLFPAIAGAIRFPEIDEGAHEANFSNIVRIYLKYMPDQAIDALMKVSTKYRMPIVDLPNSEQFIDAALAAGMGAARDVVNQIINPVLAKMGFESRKALRRAVANFQNLPEDAVVQLPGNPVRDLTKGVASAIYEMKPTGDFVLALEDEGAGT